MAPRTREQLLARRQLVSSLKPGTMAENRIIIGLSQAAATLLENGNCVTREPVGREAITAMFKSGNSQADVAYHARFEEPVHIHRETLLLLVSAMMISPYRNAGETVRVNVDATADSIIVDLPFLVPHEFMQNPIVKAVLEAVGGRMHHTPLDGTRMFVRADSPE